jgi:hypothetical protein
MPGRSAGTPTALRCSVSRPRRRTHYAHFVPLRSNSGDESVHERAARGAASPVLLVASEIAPAGHRLPRAERLVVFGPKRTNAPAKARSGRTGRASSAPSHETEKHRGVGGTPPTAEVKRFGLPGRAFAAPTATRESRPRTAASGRLQVITPVQLKAKPYQRLKRARRSRSRTMFRRPCSNSVSVVRASVLRSLTNTSVLARPVGEGRASWKLTGCRAVRRR